MVIFQKIVSASGFEFKSFVDGTAGNRNRRKDLMIKIRIYFIYTIKDFCYNNFGRLHR